MSLAGPVALASFGEAKEGMKAYKDRFIEESQMEGIKLLDSIREAVSNLQTVLSDTDLSDFELVYPDEDPVPDPKAQEEADLDELELVYPKSPTLSPSPALVPSQSEPIEIPRLSIPIPPVLVPSQCEPIQIPHLSIRLPPQASPMKSPSQGRHAFVIPANLDTPAHLYSSAPLPGSLAAYQESRNLAFPASASAPALSPQELVQSNLSHRPCCNSGCDGVVTAENSQRRCMGCVMKGWRSSDGTGQRGIKRKRKSKRVSWFDGYEKEGRDVINQDNVSDGDRMQVDELGHKPLEDDMDVDQMELYIQGWDSDLTQSGDDDDTEPGVTSTSHLAVLGPGAGRNPYPLSGTSSIRCSIKHCRNFLPLNYTWKSCPPCRKRHREYQRKRLGCESKLEKRNSAQETGLSMTPVFSKNQLGPYTLHDPAGLVTVGARICTVRGCKHIVPSILEYKYKMCFPCRVRTSRNARNRQARSERPMNGDDQMPIEVVVDPMPPQNHIRAATGRCASMDCGMRLDHEKLRRLQEKQRSDISLASSSTYNDEADTNCEQCAWRKLPLDYRKNSEIDVHRRVRIVRAEPSPSAKSPDGQLKSCIRPNSLVIRLPPRPVPPPKPRNPTPYPEYQSMSRLINELQELFLNFRRAQSYYIAYSQLQNKANSPPSPIPRSKFCFDGEFSVVAPDFEVWKRQDEVNAAVTKVMQEIERVASLKFIPNSRGFAYGGLVTRFTSKHMMALALPPELNGKTSIPLPVREMSGELEVVVLPVDSHRCFAGERTVVRFRLVG